MKEFPIYNNIPLIPLIGTMPRKFENFTKLLKRPYFKIDKKLNDYLYNNFKSDLFLWGDKVVSFGMADDGYALFPVNDKKKEQILNRNKDKIKKIKEKMEKEKIEKRNKLILLKKNLKNKKNKIEEINFDFF